MFDNEPVNNLLLVAIFSFLQFNESVAPDPTLPPALHRRRVSISAATLHTILLKHGALYVGYEFHVVMRHSEIEYAEARQTSLVLRWLNNPVNGAFIEAPR